MSLPQMSSDHAEPRKDVRPASGTRRRAIGRIAVRPSHQWVVLRDALGLRERMAANAEHLRAAMAWLCRAQDVSGCGGVSAGYYLASGWLPPYPETTGYIIETFLRYGAGTAHDTRGLASPARDTPAATGGGRYVDRAVRMGDWECEIQLPEGGVRGQIRVNDYPIVFNTGQVMLGWLALHRTPASRVTSMRRPGRATGSPRFRSPTAAGSAIAQRYPARLSRPCRLAAATARHSHSHARHTAAGELHHLGAGQARSNGWIGTWLRGRAVGVHAHHRVHHARPVGIVGLPGRRSAT